MLAHRIADGGNEKRVFYSHARGEDQPSTRRVADRGSGGVGPDPWDHKIKRLRQRVRNLEIQQEIKRLRQRIQDLELQRETRKTETESSTVVRDEGGDREQYPFGCHPPRFSEPIYQESLTDDEPDSSTVVWDESEDDSGTVVWDESDDGEEASLSFSTAQTTPTSLASSVLLDDFFKYASIVNGGGVVGLDGVGAAGGCESQELVATRGEAVDLEVPICWPHDTKDLNVELKKISSPMNMGKLQILGSTTNLKFENNDDIVNSMRHARGLLEKLDEKITQDGSGVGA
ncbi:hypothetical protein L1987_25752 [Smallanthus sonchifolius]|uniref:Uncharacterized protein n=1 Tax=Smallanthus sonchifolius TaxID=185202 RepID=A0ACB9I962_9ASTR|nr:hypothetical protein L1987_25752 [Smallanthus sonchifolius]